MEIDQPGGHAVLLNDTITGLAMKPPIAILFANLKGNVGDFAILHAILLDLNLRFPGRSLHVFAHGHHDIDEKRLAAFRALSEVEFELGGRTYFRDAEPKLSERVIRSFGLWPMAQAYFIRSLAEDVASHASRFQEYEAIFLAGGEHWGGTKGGISMFGTLNAVHRHNDRIFAYPFSVNPRMCSFNSKQALQRNFAKIRKPLVVRDGNSQKVLAKLGIDAVLGADSVYTMDPIANEVAPMANRDSSRILFALTGSRRKFEADLRAALQKLNSFRNNVTLMTTCEFEDGERCEATAREFQIDYSAPVTWQDAVAEIKASSLLVTNRLHGLILGSLAGTPLLPITNRKKAEAFVKDAQMPYSAPSVDALSSELIQRCLDDREAILKKMKAYQESTGNVARSPITRTSNELSTEKSIDQI